MAVGLFVSLFTILWLGRRTFIDALTLLRILGLCCVAGAVVPFTWSGSRVGMERLEWFLLNVVGLGPLCLSLLLAINHYVHGPVRWVEGRIGQDLEVVLADGPYVRREVISADAFAFTDGEREEAVKDTFRAGVARGYLGYWSITNVEVVR